MTSNDIKSIQVRLTSELVRRSQTNADSPPHTNPATLLDLAEHDINENIVCFENRPDDFVRGVTFSLEKTMPGSATKKSGLGPVERNHQRHCAATLVRSRQYMLAPPTTIYSSMSSVAVCVVTVLTM